MPMMGQNFFVFKHVTVNNPSLPVSADMPEGIFRVLPSAWVQRAQPDVQKSERTSELISTRNHTNR